jgi:hypothetical protein
MSANVSSLFELVMVDGFAAEAGEGYVIVLVFNSRETRESGVALIRLIDWHAIGPCRPVLVSCVGPGVAAGYETSPVFKLVKF